MDIDVSLREATEEDVRRMFEWRNDPAVYRWFRNQDGELDWESHVEWFANRPDTREDLIIEDDGTPVGVVAIATDGDVSIYIGDRSLWGRGLATAAVERAINSVDRPLSAQIHEDNSASIKLFEAVGFERTGQDGSWIVYERQ